MSICQTSSTRTPAPRVLHLTVVAAAVAGLPGWATAQTETSSTLPTVVVSAARIEQRIDDTFAAVTVLQRADIEASQAVDLVTLLRQVPGVEVAQLGGYGTQASAFIRGGDPRHTLVMVDGVPLSSLNFGLAPLEHLTLTNIERIEVARGNLSSLYGSSALGGVIQIFTTGKVRGLQVSGSVSAASHDAHSVKAAFANRVGGVSFGIDASHLRTGGYNVTDQAKIPGTNPDEDGYRNSTFGGLLAYENGPWNGELRLRRSQGRAEYDSEFGPDTQADESKFSVDTATAAVGYRTQTLSSELRVSSSQDDLRADVTAFPYYVKTKSRQIGWSGVWTAAAGHRISGALEQAKGRIDSDTLYGTTRRTQDTARLGYNGEIGAHQWQANVRHDRYSDFGDVTTGLVGYGYKLTESLRISGTVANGFNAPTFNDLFNPFGGNPDLKPEHSVNREVALNYDDAHLSARATVFDNTYRDLIGNDALFNRVNIGRARVRGVELTASFQLGVVLLSPSLTVQDPENTVTHTDLPRRAHKLAALHASFDAPGGWRLGADLRIVGSRYDRVGNVQPLEGYSTLDITAQKQLVAGWTLLAGVRNLSDETYESAYGYKTPGRVASVTLSYAMK